MNAKQRQDFCKDKLVEFWNARASAYESAALSLSLEKLGTDVEKTERINVVNDLYREAKNLRKHATAILQYGGIRNEG